ncbi:uncharacterized protein C11orf71 homolog [Tupaia chinensis]|uniref:uncharacterized protein C11orf71 homolog n=1 Tax=Tupaia chinensis TaxID=246437 RepID=UPI0003C8FC51|nr:uncharacterized protein C11orf71 homolog [Tupaia chinensis]
MAPNSLSLSAGDQGDGAAYRTPHGDLSRPALALAMVSGDSAFVFRPEAIRPGPRQAVRPSVRTESRRLAGGGRSSTRLIKGREPDGRTRSRQARFSPYPSLGVKLDLLRSVLQQRLIAFGSVIAARISV